MRDSSSVAKLILEAQSELFGWVEADYWFAMHPHDSREKIRTREKAGTWKLGVHIARPSRKELWINLRNVQAWIKGLPPPDASPGPGKHAPVVL